MRKAREVHWKASLRILTYVKGSPGKGVLYKKHGHLQIEAFSDSSYAGDKKDRKSTFGYFTYVRGNLVTWRSNKQIVVSCSRVEAEYRAMAHTAWEMMWLNILLGELGFCEDGPMSI